MSKHFHNPRKNLVRPGAGLQNVVVAALVVRLLQGSARVFSRVGQPVDVADVITFLASHEARRTIGQVIDATGGGLQPFSPAKH